MDKLNYWTILISVEKACQCLSNNSHRPTMLIKLPYWANHLQWRPCSLSSTAPSHIPLADSVRAIEDRRLLGHIRQSWLESGSVYGYRKESDDLKDLGEQCGRNRVYRLMKQANLRSQTGYRKRVGVRHGPPAVLAPNRLQQQFDVAAPNEVWIAGGSFVLNWVSKVRGSPTSGATYGEYDDAPHLYVQCGASCLRVVQ